MAKHHKKITKRRLKKYGTAEKVVNLFFYIRKHSTKVVIAIGGIIVILGVGIYFRESAKRTQKLAEFEFREAMNIYGAGDIQEAIARFEDILRLYPKTNPGVNSLYWLGNLYYFQGKYKEARKYFNDYLNKGRDQLIIQSAFLGIADTYLQENDNFYAAQKYEELATKFPDSWLAPKALLQAIRCYQMLNQPTKANSILQKLTQSYPSSIYTQKAKSLIINLM